MCTRQRILDRCVRDILILLLTLLRYNISYIFIKSPVFTIISWIKIYSYNFADYKQLRLCVETIVLLCS